MLLKHFSGMPKKGFRKYPSQEALEDVVDIHTDEPFSQPDPSAQLGSFQILKKDQIVSKTTQGATGLLKPQYIASAALTEQCFRKRLGRVSSLPSSDTESPRTSAFIALTISD